MVYNKLSKVITCLYLPILIGCGIQSENVVKQNKKFIPNQYIALTNINLDVIQDYKHKELIDKLNTLPCECPQCSPGISIAQCISTNKFCSYSIMESKKLIKKYKKNYYKNKKLTYSIWDAARSNNLNGLYRHLIRNTQVDKQNVSGETPIYLSIKSDKYDSTFFLMLSGANLNQINKNSTNPKIILNQRNWGTALIESVNQYNLKFKTPICILFQKIFDKVDWNSDEVRLLSIKNKTWPDMSLGQNEREAQLQVIVKGIQVLIKYKKIDYELNLLFPPHKKAVKLTEIKNKKDLLYEGLNF